MHHSTRTVHLGFLALALASCSTRAPTDEPRLTRTARLITIDAAFETRASSGLSLNVEVAVVSPERPERWMVGTCKLVFDTWDKIFLIRRRGPDAAPAENGKAETLADALRHCIDQKAVDALARELPPARGEYVLVVRESYRVPDGER
jgi:hypothetical protein